MEKMWTRHYSPGVPKEINPDIYESLTDMLEQLCGKYGSLKAVTNMGVSMTYSQYDKLATAFAAYLQKELHLKKGDRIALMMPNTLQYAVAVFGAHKAGLIIVNVNPLYTSRELIHQLNDSGAESIVIFSTCAHVLEESLPHVQLKHIIITELGDLFPFPKKQIVNFVVKYIKKLVKPYHISGLIHFSEVMRKGSSLKLEEVSLHNQDIAFLQYTGGTTGVSKGAVLTHRNILANVIQIYSWVKPFYREGREAAILPLPLYHIYALTCFFTYPMAGCEVIMITNPRDIGGFVKELKKSTYTMFTGINTLMRALMMNAGFRKLNFSKLRFTTTGGMAATSDVAKDWVEVTGRFVTQGYGLTEASPIVTLNPLDKEEYDGSIGLPLPSTDVMILNSNGNGIGELCVKGPQVMKQYWNMPEETAKVFTPEGWLRTGDMARIDNEGYIYLVDRLKDMIIVSGFNVYPNEIEEVLVSHPGIVEAGVVGEPDAAHGEVVKAYVVKRDKKITKEEIIAYCHEKLTNYKVPRIIVFTESLPKSPVGKILRKELRKEPAYDPL